MAKVWQIEGWDGDRLVFEREVAGNLTEPEVSAMLQRLTCRYLSDMEIIKASVRKGDPEYAPLLERIGTESLMCYGHLAVASERTFQGLAAAADRLDWLRDQPQSATPTCTSGQSIKSTGVPLWTSLARASASQLVSRTQPCDSVLLTFCGCGVP